MVDYDNMSFEELIQIIIDAETPCGGWQCDCSLELTDKRRSPDALGRLMDIATAANIEDKSIKYSPDQPRVPAGDPDGGQWTSEETIINNKIDIIAKEISSKDVEYLYILDKDGNILSMGIGDAIHFEADITQIEQAGNNIIIHNHPGINNNFSFIDIRNSALYDVKETIVISKDINGSIIEFSIKRPNNGWPGIGKMMEYTRDNTGTLYSKFNEYRESGLTFDEAHDKVIEYFANETGAIYKKRIIG